jgi:hypothetical protein
MQTSKIIEVDGVFLGAAVALPSQQGWQFIAANGYLTDINGHIASSFIETQRIARQAFLQARMAAAA